MNAILKKDTAFLSASVFLSLNFKFVEKILTLFQVWIIMRDHSSFRSN